MKFSTAIVAVALATGLVGCAANDEHESDDLDGLQLSEMDQESFINWTSVINAVQEYATVERAIAAGFQLGYNGAAAGCVANPTLGAMGYHYFHYGRMEDPSIKAFQPEVLVYQRAADGTLKLGAVEWVVPKVNWEAAGNVAPPKVFGQTLHVINPVLNWYVQHAWVLKYNPSGFFADWNPDVTCP